MNFRQTLAPVAVLAALALGTAVPARADTNQDHHRDRRQATERAQPDRRAQARARAPQDRGARDDRRDHDVRSVPYQRYDRDDRYRGDDRDNRYRGDDRHDDRPFIRIVPRAIVVNPYRSYPWWSDGRRFSVGLYIGTVAPFRWAAPPPVFAGEPYAAYGAVTFDLHPDDALVYVDGQYVGQVEDFRDADRPLTLVAGRHDVFVQARGYEPMQFSVDVLAGRLVPYRGDLVQAGVWR